MSGDDYMNLADIIGRPSVRGPAPPYHDDERVVEFRRTDDGGLDVVEMCDENFSITLTPAELDALIAWLQATRTPKETA
jgi:hypothetical protein